MDKMAMKNCSRLSLAWQRHPESVFVLKEVGICRESGLIQSTGGIKNGGAEALVGKWAIGQGWQGEIRVW